MDGTPLMKSDGTPVVASDGTPRMGTAGDPCCCNTTPPPTCISTALYIRRSSVWGCGESAKYGNVCGYNTFSICKYTGTLRIGTETFTAWRELNISAPVMGGYTIELWAYHFGLSVTGGRLFFVRFDYPYPGATWIWDDGGGVRRNDEDLVCGSAYSIVREKSPGQWLTGSRQRAGITGTQTLPKILELDPGDAEYIVWLANGSPVNAFGPNYIFLFVPPDAASMDAMRVGFTNLAISPYDCTAQTRPPNSIWRQTAVWDCQQHRWVRGGEVRVDISPEPSLGVWMPAAAPENSVPKGCILHAYTKGADTIADPTDGEPAHCCGCACPEGGVPESLTAAIQGFNTARDTALGIYWDPQTVETWSYDPNTCQSYQGELTMYYWSDDPDYGTGWFQMPGTVSLWLDSIACKWKCAVYTTQGDRDADAGVEGTYSDGTVVEGGI